MFVYKVYICTYATFSHGLVAILNGHYCFLLVHTDFELNEANLRDLIAATGLVLVILLKLDSNRRFLGAYDQL